MTQVNPTIVKTIKSKHNSISKLRKSFNLKVTDDALELIRDVSESVITETSNTNQSQPNKRKSVKRPQVDTPDTPDNKPNKFVRKNKPSNESINENKSDLTEDNEFNNNRTIYIEGLPYELSEDDIETFFASAGSIKSIRLPKWHDSGRLRGYGHIEFNDVKSATLALELDGNYLGNRYIKVDRPLTPKVLQAQNDTDKKHVIKPVGCRSVFIKNIPYDATEDDIKAALMVCGPITNIRLPIWGHTQQKKGFGYVEFKREDSAEIAVKKSGVLKICDRCIIIDFETGTPKKGFKVQSSKK